MKERCYNENAERYERYGGRGITVCDRWRTSFENFLADMGRRPSRRHSLDRIRVNEHYEPGNCRWATPKEQSRNKQRTVFVDGVSLPEAIEKAGLVLSSAVYNFIYRRIKRGLSFSRAVIDLNLFLAESGENF